MDVSKARSIDPSTFLAKVDHLLRFHLAPTLRGGGGGGQAEIDGQVDRDRRKGRSSRAAVGRGVDVE